MGKRKLSGGEATPAKEVEAKEEEQKHEDPEDGPGPIDLNPLKFLISPKEIPDFVSEHWEKAPLHVPADEDRKKFFSGLFDFEGLAKLADQLEAGTMIIMDQDPGPKGDSLSLDDDINDEMIRATGPLMFGRDVVAARYIDGKRETISGDFADSDTLRTLYTKAGATLQLHQPQRFINGVWRLVAALETQAGCLVGCNAYMTPKNGQGLAPHHDDVELFVCQTQGTKKWRLYKPANGFELPSKVSGDLPQEELGKPILEVTMQPGDVLYIPRGTVHQAVAQEEGSCHLTISTYQNWTWGDLAETVIETARNAQGDSKCALPLELRRGLPLGFIFRHGLQVEVLAKDAAAAAAAAKPDAASLAAGLRALADQLEAEPTELLTPAVDEISLDFLRSRIPPHPCQVPDEGEPPTLEDSLACRGKNLFRLMHVEMPNGGMSDSDEEDEEEGEGEEEDVEEEDEEGGAHLKLVTCLMNNRYTHMMSTVDEESDEDEDEDEEHDHDHEGPCGTACMLGSGSADEDEEAEEEKEEEEKENKKEEVKAEEGAKKGKKEEETTIEEDVKEEAEEKEKKGGKGKKSGKGKKAAEEEEEEVEEVEIDEMDVSEQGEGEIDGDEDDEEAESDEEEDLPGLVFPVQYSVVLADVLASSLEHPLPVRHLRVPGADSEEQLRLAQLLHDFGCVVTVSGGKAKQEEAAPAAAAEKEEEKEEKAAKEEDKGGKKEAEKKKELAKKEEAAKKEDAKGASPAAKKAKKAK